MGMGMGMAMAGSDLNTNRSGHNELFCTKRENGPTYMLRLTEGAKSDGPVFLIFHRFW